jgi:hypothetical protein
MLGWKPVERRIDPSLSLEEAKAVLEDMGFEDHVVNPEHIIMKREGTQRTLRGEELPIEAAVAEAESGLFLQVRYATFALFDTGDLESFTDDVASRLAA